MIDWLKEILLASALLMGFVLVARRPVALWAGPKLSYALWLLPLVRILMPPLPVGGMTFLDLFAAITPQASHMDSPQPRLSDVQLSMGSQHWEGLLVLAWLGGAVIYLLFQLLRYRSFLQVLVAAKTGADFEIETVRVWTSAAAQGPLAVGVLRPQVVLPADFHNRFGEAERELVLAHELMHHRRGDLVSNMAALVLLSLQWFNPIAHIAFRRFRDDQELACDADVIAAKGVASRYDYGRVLAKAACQRNSWPLCTLKPAEVLKVRLKSLAQGYEGGQRRLAGVAIFTVFAAVLLLVSPRMPSAPNVDLTPGVERVSVITPGSQTVSTPAASDRLTPQRSPVAPRMTGAPDEDSSSAGMDPVQRTAFERSVEATTMQGAPALEAAVEARHGQARPHLPA